VRYGFVLPGGSATEQLEQAVLADGHGWDGVFVWEAAYGIDAWTLLGAMAQRTTNVRLGTMLTPLPWRRPWKLASQVLTLDQVSGGRAILTVGLGAVDPALGSTGEETDRRIRAERLDEGIDLIAALWAGERHFTGAHYQADFPAEALWAGVTATAQRPRVPIWVVGAWPRPRSMRRVLRCDGLVPVSLGDDGMRATTPEDITAMRAWLDANGGTRPGFDLVMEGSTPADDAAGAAAVVRPWEEAGCTWWLEARWESPDGDEQRADEVRRRLEAGPPRLS
jgi:alkanesulfonate monooxygenase SsuD/methylene tetrahydromethanopterin reductase-like flavin-dependent oxidoreductase (luciferase family)